MRECYSICRSKSESSKRHFKVVRWMTVTFTLSYVWQLTLSLRVAASMPLNDCIFTLVRRHCFYRFRVSRMEFLMTHVICWNWRWWIWFSWTTARQASLSITNSQSPPKFMSIVSVMPPNHLSLCCSLLLLPSVFPSIRVFSNESALRIRWPKYWSFSFNISPTNEHPGLIFS